MRSRIAGDERAEGAEGFAEGADQHGHVVRAQVEVLADCRARELPTTPSPCASSTMSQAPASRAARASSGSGARSPSMLNTPSVTSSRVRWTRRALEELARMARIAMAVAQRVRASQAAAIDQ